MILDALHKIANHGSSLTRDEARDVMAEVLRGEATDAQSRPAGRQRIAHRFNGGKACKKISESPGDDTALQPRTYRSSYSIPDLRNNVMNSCSKLHF